MVAQVRPGFVHEDCEMWDREQLELPEEQEADE